MGRDIFERLEPLVSALLSLFLGEPIPLLQFAGELITASGDVIEVVIGKISPLLLNRTLEPVSTFLRLDPSSCDDTPIQIGALVGAFEEAREGPIRSMIECHLFCSRRASVDEDSPV